MSLLSILITSLCLLVWIASMYRNWAYGRIKNTVEQARALVPQESELPALSVVVIAHNQSHELRSNLPLILNQIYRKFEVIVVDMNSKDDTKELLEHLEEDHANLHHTFTPATSRDISRQRLAITLGIKAATNDWIVLTQADCTPISHLWLRRMAETLNAHRAARMVVGYTRYNKAQDYTERRMRFFRFWQQMLNLNYALTEGAYQHDGTNLLYSKELFLSHQGFASHSTLQTGATEIMVNQHSTPHNTAVCLHPESIMEQNMLHRKHWKQDRLFFQETRRHFTRKWHFRMRYAGSVLLHAMWVLSMMLTIGFFLSQKNYIASAVFLLLWLTHFVYQGMKVSKSYQLLENARINYFSVAWFIHLIPFWDTKAWLRHLFTQKRKFRKRYI